jgi:site-specific DNA-methyltransferase (adenine-specific)
MRRMPDNSVDLLFTDPPYALGSEIVIRPDGKVDYKKARDFMAKWDMPTGEFWEEWYKEAFRVLKYGGHCLMFGIDRQLLLFKYYGALAGFTEKQSLYWYFISNFPKATDLSKKIDSFAKFGKANTVAQKKSELSKDGERRIIKQTNNGLMGEIVESEINIGSKPEHPLAKKYSGYKYSIAPLKQTCETIMVFQKPYKTGSCLHDTLAYEAGEEGVTVGVLDIDGNRVGAESRYNGKATAKKETFNCSFNTEYAGQEVSGRYPSQTYCSSLAGEALDRQSGVKKSGAMKSTHLVGKTGKNGYMPHHGIYGKYKARPFQKEVKASEGGCSKILHKCDYEEHDLFIYCPKVGKKERNEGCEDLEDKEFSMSNSGKAENYKCGMSRETVVKNNHPTVKPLKLLTQILKLFKTPNPQVVLDPFMGSGSLGIVCRLEDVDFIGIEKNEEYFKIAKTRIKNYVRKESKYNGETTGDTL